MMTKQEFGHISTRIRGKLVALARRFSRAAGTSDDAEDIAQEALVTLWELSEKGYPVRDAEVLCEFPVLCVLARAHYLKSCFGMRRGKTDDRSACRGHRRAS